MKLLATPEETRQYNELEHKIISLANEGTDQCPCCEEKMPYAILGELVVTPGMTLFENSSKIKDLLRTNPFICNNFVKLTKIFGFDEGANEIRGDYFYCTCGAKWRGYRYKIPSQYETNDILKNIHDDEDLKKVAETFVIYDD